MDDRAPHPFIGTILANQGQSFTTISAFDAASKMSITPSRQTEGPSLDSNNGPSTLQRVSTSFDLKGRVAMGPFSGDTAFFALSKRSSPIEHLHTLRGFQDETLLHTDEFMSPVLHNSSDAYHRHIRSQLFYSNELRQGRHQKQWLKKTQQRKLFVDFTRTLEDYSPGFMHGYRFAQKKKREEGEDTYEYEDKKEDYLLRESEGMERRGWAPEDWAKIQLAIVKEDSERGEQEMECSFNSIETADTTLSSIFDSEEEDEDTDDENEYDHLYAFDDGKSNARRTSHEDATIQELTDKQEIQSNITTEDTTTPQETTTVGLSAINIITVPSALLPGQCTDDESDEESSDEEESEEEDSEGDDEESDEEDDGETWTPSTNSPPSRLLSSFCYRPGKDSDSDDEEDDQEETENSIIPNSPSPPASPYLDKSAILDAQSSNRDEELSSARRRQYEFTSALLAVRKQVELDIEADAELEAMEAKEEAHQKVAENYESNLLMTVVSLRLHMFANGLSPIDQQERFHFIRNKAIGKHEVEFKGRLREMNKRGKGFGDLAEYGFWNTKNNGEWADEMAYLDAFRLIRQSPHLALQAVDDDDLRREMETSAEAAQDLQYMTQYRAKEAIKYAIWHGEEVFEPETEEYDADAQICWDD